MVNPFAEGSMVMEVVTNEPSGYVQFEPDGLPGAFWLHRRDDFDTSLAYAAVVDRYSLPESNNYEVRIVEVPADVELRMGSIGARHGRSGGGDLVDPIEYDAIPASWIVDSAALDVFLEE